MRIWLTSVVSTLLFFCNSIAQSPDSSKSSASLQAPAIKATVQLDKKEVPRNRKVTCTVTVTWQGALNRYEILEVESPVLTNLEEVGNSSSNSVGESGGVQQAVRTFAYILQPIDLGMAYIDGTIIEYTDSETDETYRLVTDRLELTIIDPIKDRSLKPFVLTAAVLFVLAAATAAGFVLIKRKKVRKAELERQAQDSIPIEERYISDLNQSIDLKSSNPVETFSALSKLFRRYLSEKYGIQGMEITTKEIGNELNALAVAENIVLQVDEVLNSCDVAKFSGGQVERGTLDRAYTLVEDILTKNKSEQLAAIQSDDNS